MVNNNNSIDLNIGQGDYTAERGQLLDGITLEDVIKNVRELDARKTQG